jgi:hypothetical protein
MAMKMVNDETSAINQEIRALNDRWNSEIRELDDRWILRPLRGRHAIRVEWRSHDIELVLDSSDRIIIGYRAELSPRSLAPDDPDRKTISHWNRPFVEQIITSEILSAVAFKSGDLRLGFRNGWNLFTYQKHSGTPSAIYSGDQMMWSPSGIGENLSYPIRFVNRNP